MTDTGSLTRLVVVSLCLATCLVVFLSLHARQPVADQDSDRGASGGRTAVAVLVTKSLPDGYVCGAAVLARSFLRFAEHRHVDLVAMVTGAVDAKTRALLLREGYAATLAVEPIPHPTAGQDMLADRFLDTYTKLRAWQLTSYDQVLLLDADTLVARPLTALLSDVLPTDHVGAVVDCCDKFNSGVLLLRPSAALFADMLRRIPTTPSYDGGDQGFLNEYFADRWLRLPYSYNAVQLTLPSRAWSPADAAIIHYMDYKPWRNLPDHQLHLAPLHDLWWDLTTGPDDFIEQICS